MEFDELKKQHLAKSNWRAHVANYVELKRQKKRQKKGDFSPEQYCKQQKINYEAFKVWLEYIKKEDKYVFYMSFATEYLDRAKRSLSLVKKYINEQELRMPLMRDAIVAYAAPFTRSNGRIFIKEFSLEKIESFIPPSLMTVHRKVCADRDQVIGHCDVGVRNPRVGIFGITLKGAGYYWTDYQKLIPEFEKLILAVQENLRKYNQDNLTPLETYFEEFSNPPACAEEDPGPPPKNIP